MKWRRSPLRWPGSKHGHLKELYSSFPERFENYFEPFVGSAVVFYNLEIKGKAFLSDVNSELINFYTVLVNDTEIFFELVSQKKNTEQFYYSERAQNPKSNIERAARFYYLNRTCFNGIYRVNKAGKFNVPYGRRRNLIILDKENLLSFKEKLLRAEISFNDFEKSKKKPSENDFIFFDPPYSSTKTYETFTMYNECLFSWDDQIRLAEYCKELNSKNVKIMVSNLYHNEIKNLFHKELNFKTKEISKFSRVAGQLKDRKPIKEYLFTNY